MAFTVLSAGLVFIAFVLHVQAKYEGMGGGGGSKCVPDIIESLSKARWKLVRILPNITLFL